jgi:hypothetical protein
MIYQLRIVLRDISPLIWRRLLVHSDTTLAHLHPMLQILFAWSDEHLHHFHIFGKDYGSNAADTRHVTLQSFAFQPGERFRYVYSQRPPAKPEACKRWNRSKRFGCEPPTGGPAYHRSI